MNKICINKKLVFVIVGLILFGIVGFSIHTIKNNLSFLSPRITTGKKIFQNVPDYQLGSCYYIAFNGRDANISPSTTSWKENFIKFDEKTQKIFNLASIQYKGSGLDGLTLKNNGTIFYVRDGGEVWKMDLNGKKIEKMTDTNGNVSDFYISPNEKHVAYEVNDLQGTKRYLLNLNDKKIILLPVNPSLPEYQQDSNYFLSEWIDDSNILYSTNGSSGYVWNMKDNTFSSDLSQLQKDREKYSGDFYPSPNGSHKIFISMGGDSLLLYNSNYEVELNTYIHHKLVGVSGVTYGVVYEPIGWTQDSRFFFFKAVSTYPEKTKKSDALGVIDTQYNKTTLYYIDKLTSPIKDVEMYAPYIQTPITSGRVYFVIKPSHYLEGKKIQFTDQLWMFDIKDESFEKIKNIEEKSDWNIDFTEFFYKSNN